MEYLKNRVSVKLNKPIKECKSFLKLAKKLTGSKYVPYALPKPDKNKKVNERREKRKIDTGFDESVLSRFKALTLKDNVDIEIAITQLLECEDVEIAYKVPKVTTLYTPSDPTFDNCWHLKTSEGYSINAEEAWDVAGVDAGNGIVIATIEPLDEGCRFTHEIFSSSGSLEDDWADIVSEAHPCLLPNYYPDLDGSPDRPTEWGHNTMTASDIVAQENGVGYTAGAYKSKVMLTYFGHGDGDGIGDAIIRAVDQGVDILSLSLTGNSRYTTSYQTAVDYAIANGVFVVWAHGFNDDTDKNTFSIPETLSVSSHDSSGARHYSYGSVKVSSPGIDIWRAGIMADPGEDSRDYDDYYQYGSGNSNATPIVASVVALLMEKNPTWNIADIYQAVIKGCKAGANQSTDGSGNPIWDVYYGWGCIDAKNSLDLTIDNIGVLSPDTLEVITPALYRHKLGWNNTLKQTNYSHTVLVRKEDSLPTSPTDGEVLYSGTGSEIGDYTWFFNGTWYLAVFNVDTDGNYSTPWGDAEDAEFHENAPVMKKIITSYESPVAGFTETGDLTGIAPLTVEFSDNSDGRLDHDYHTWDFGDGNTSTERYPDHVYTVEGTYSVEHTAGNPLETDSITKTDLITVYETAVADFSYDSGSISYGGTVVFTNSSTGTIDTYLWDFGDGNTSAEENPTHVYNSMGTFDVSLTVSGNGGTDTKTVSGAITVGENVSANFSYSTGSIVVGNSIDFTNESTGDYSTSSWTFGDGESSIEENPTHTYDSIGTYDVSLLISGSGGDDTKTVSDAITVTTDIDAGFIVGTPRLEKHMIRFLDNSSGSIDAYSWDFGDGTYSDAENPVHAYEEYGEYTVKLEASGVGKGSDFSTQKITVSRGLSTDASLLQSESSYLQKEVIKNVYKEYLFDYTVIKLSAVYDGDTTLIYDGSAENNGAYESTFGTVTRESTWDYFRFNIYPTGSIGVTEDLTITINYNDDTYNYDTIYTTTSKVKGSDDIWWIIFTIY